MQLNSSRIVASGVGLVAMIGLAFLLFGQEPPPSHARISLPHDWSHRHVVFSNPTTLEQSLRVRQDARFWHQWYRRNVHQAIPVAESAFDEPRERDENLPWLDGDWFGWFGRFPRRHRTPPPPNALKRDWTISLGPHATVGAGNYPAKFSFDITTANCGNALQPDFVVFNTSVATSGQASIVAYDNLYSGCATGAVPSTYWAYNTGGSVITSVTLSLDGSQVAFVQTPTTSAIANLVLLKWKATTDGATSTSPDTINIVSNSAYPTCTRPCMTTLAFSGGANDTNSSPFYDFANDALYVGDNGGLLHKFHPVFDSGTLVEVGSSWPAVLGSGANKLDSPVLDSVTGRVFVGTLYNGTSGAQLFAIDSSTGTVVGTSSSLGKGNGIADAPVVDPTTGKVYAFLGNDGSTNCSGPCGAVHQFATSFASGTGISTAVGFGGSITLYAGSFDNAYYTSADGTGTLFVCGQGFPGFFPAEPMIHRIPISSGTMSTSSQFGAGLGTGNVPCSPVTEVFNPAAGAGGTDRIFASVASSGSAAGCSSNGCIMNVIVTSWQPSTSYAVGQSIITPNNNLMVVATAGISKSGGPPAWPDVLLTDDGMEITEGTVTWVNSGFDTTATPALWQGLTFFSQGTPIIDSNGNRQLTINSAVASGVVRPIWNTAIGGTTIELTGLQWRNGGPMANFGLAVNGGTSGIVVDNVVPTGTLAGGSQVYFSPLTLGFGTCGAGNGCAVQASQAALK
jgi:hypothetical protein